jgi:chorismate mutase
MNLQHEDPVVQTLRGEIEAVDERLLAAVNERIAVVARLHRYKAEHGIPTRDPAREEELVQYLTTLNPGPLTPAGLAELYTFVLDLVRREAAANG